MFEYEKDGFTIVKNQIPNSLIDSLKNVLKDGLMKYCFTKNDLNLDELILELESKNHDYIYQSSLLIGSSASAYQFIGGTKLIENLENITGIKKDNLHFMPLAIKIQPPNATEYDYLWHQESAFYPNSPDVITVWFPINYPSSFNSGTMVVIPKSHLNGVRKSDTYFSYKTFKQIECSASYEEEQSGIPIEIDIGDICIFDPNTVHMSTVNQSDKVRITGILRVIDFSKQKESRPFYKGLSE